MNQLLIFAADDVPPVPRGKLSLDLDAASDRLLVLDRTTATPLLLTKVFSDKTLDILLPASYATTNNIVVVLMDDNNVFNAVAADRVQLELVQTRLTA